MEEILDLFDSNETILLLDTDYKEVVRYIDNEFVGFWDNDYTQEMGNPCWEGYIRYPDPRYPNGNVITSEYVKRELPGNGDYGIVVVNDISGNEKTFCVNDFVWYRKTTDNKFSGLGSIYCSNDLRSW